jgi:hypothetical protein
MQRTVNAIGRMKMETVATQGLALRDIKPARDGERNSLAQRSAAPLQPLPRFRIDRYLPLTVW